MNDDERDEVELPDARAKRLPSWLTYDLARVGSMAFRRPSMDAEVRVDIEQDGRRELWVGTCISDDDDGFDLRPWGSANVLHIPWADVRRAAYVGPHTFAQEQAARRPQRKGLPALVLVDGQWVSPCPPPPEEDPDSLRGTYSGLRHVRPVRLTRAQRRRRAKEGIPFGATARGERPCRRPGSRPPPLEGPALPISDRNLQRVFEYAKANGITLPAALDRLLVIAFGRLDALRRYGKGKGVTRRREYRARCRAANGA